jgi:hypothetical protein
VHCERAAERSSPFAAVLSSAANPSPRFVTAVAASTRLDLSHRPAEQPDSHLRDDPKKRIWGDRQKSRSLGAEMHLGDRGLGLKPALDGEEPAYFPYVNSNPLTGADRSGLGGISFAATNPFATQNFGRAGHNPAGFGGFDEPGAPLGWTCWAKMSGDPNLSDSMAERVACVSGEGLNTLQHNGDAVAAIVHIGAIHMDLISTGPLPAGFSSGFEFPGLKFGAQDSSHSAKLLVCRFARRVAQDIAAAHQDMGPMPVSQDVCVLKVLPEFEMGVPGDDCDSFCELE